MPLVATIVGEGGSGGAIALAAADRILMLEHSIYSVISPEGCAAILWRSADQAPVAAEALRLTAQDLLGHRLVDLVIQEPMGGAHRGRATTIAAVGDAIEGQLRPLLRLSPAELKRSRRDKFLRMGQPAEPKAAPAPRLGWPLPAPVDHRHQCQRGQPQKRQEHLRLEDQAEVGLLAAVEHGTQTAADAGIDERRPG